MPRSATRQIRAQKSAAPVVSSPNRKPPTESVQLRARRITRSGYLVASNEGSSGSRVKRSRANADSTAVATAVPSAAAEPDFGSAVLDPQANELIEEARAHESSHLSARDRSSALVLGLAFIGVAGTLPFVVDSDRSPSFVSVAALVAVYAIASNASFEVGMGLVPPTELFLVPMLFILPLGVVPLAVALGLLLGAVLGHLRRGPPLDQ